MLNFGGVTSYSMTFWDGLSVRCSPHRGPASSCQREADHQGLVNRCFWCGHGKKLLGLEDFFLSIWGFYLWQGLQFLVFAGLFSYDRFFFTLTQNNDFFLEFTVVDFFGKDWRIGWLVGGWEFEVGIPAKLQLIIPLLKKHFYFHP